MQNKYHPAHIYTPEMLDNMMVDILMAYSRQRTLLQYQATYPESRYTQAQLQKVAKDIKRLEYKYREAYHYILAHSEEPDTVDAITNILDNHYAVHTEGEEE